MIYLDALPRTELDWNALRPVLDDALAEWSTADREPILLRYFEERSLAAVGEALGLSENSARMRANRALEKLRVRLLRRGVTSTTAALGVALRQQPAVIARTGLAGTVAGGALAGAAVAGTAGFLQPMSKAKSACMLVGATASSRWASPRSNWR